MPERFHDDPAAANPTLQKRKHDTAVPEAGADNYRGHDGRRAAGPAACPDCGAILSAGRWVWGDRPANAADVRCPACERVRDGYPAGFVTLSGPFLGVHRGEIENLVRNVADVEGQEHPLHRIIAIEPSGAGLLITTTDVHLPRRIGEAVHRAYDGDLVVQYAGEDQVVRVAWAR